MTLPHYDNLLCFAEKLDNGVFAVWNATDKCVFVLLNHRQ